MGQGKHQGMAGGRGRPQDEAIPGQVRGSARRRAWREGPGRGPGEGAARSEPCSEAAPGADVAGAVRPRAGPQAGGLPGIPGRGHRLAPGLASAGASSRVAAPGGRGLGPGAQGAAGRAGRVHAPGREVVGEGRGQLLTRRQRGRRRCGPFKLRGCCLAPVGSGIKGAAGQQPADASALLGPRRFPAAVRRGQRRLGEAEPQERGPGRPRGAVAAVTAAPGPAPLPHPSRRR